MMAERRMFAKTIIDSDAFLDMPLSTQSLYFHLSMRADDDGFINNPKKIQRMIGATNDDTKLLIAKNFIIPFESGVVVIKHWKIHNYIRQDRKKETVYPDEMSMLDEKENGAYTLRENEEHEKVETDRQKAYRESSLPYSFWYKIKEKFYGKPCPVCGATMQTGISNNRIPTIQHNIPISKGGKHELGNISVICKQCNVSIKDTETDELNASEVVKVWDEICAADKCLQHAGQATDKCQLRLGKDSIDKDNIYTYPEDQNTPDKPKKAKKEKPTKHKHGEYNNVLLTDDELDKLKAKFPDWEDRIERLSIYIESKGAKYKSHYATILNWARREGNTGRTTIKNSIPKNTGYAPEQDLNDLDDLF